MKNALGVIGGMGPLATADFLKKLTLATDASCDQEHIPVVLYGDCTTPDRTANVLGKGPSPLPQLLAGIEFLNQAGVAAIAIPCNSAHCWYDDMKRASRVPVLHIVQASADQVRRNDRHARRVGVLSTEGTHRMGIYRTVLEQAGLEPLAPTAEEFRDFISPAIADIKANRLADAESKFDVAADRLQQRGAEQIILGCTEIPLGMQTRAKRRDPVLVDSTLSLVIAVLKHFGKPASLDGLLLANV
jgi:aspartate racemase